MQKMRAILCTKYGPPEVLQIGQAGKPVPKSNEVLIKVYATSVTNSDIFIRSSRVGFALIVPFRLMIGVRRPRNPIIGEVFAGKVESAGTEIRRFKTGDRVCGLTGFSLGAYAEYMTMKEVDSKRGCLAIMPGNISFEAATSAAYGGLLALQSMEKGAIVPGSNVLIYGASGTSGTFAVQYAKHLGAAVTGVCSASNAEFVKSLGADHVIDYTRENSAGALGTYDFILDAVGKARTSDLKKACAKALSEHGTYASIDDSALLLDSERLNRITKLVEAGHVKPVTDRAYQFEQIAEAHRYVETGHKRGNVAVTVTADR